MRTCIFCLKICNGFGNRTPLNENDSVFASKTEPPAGENEGLQMFFNFLERYLSDDGLDKPKSSNQPSLFNKLKERRACEDCLKTVKAFCDLYHDLKTIQLLLNWQLCTLKDVMITAKRFPTEQDKAKVSDAADDKDDSFRKELIENVSHKLLSSYPKLMLKKIPTLDGSREIETEAGVDNLQISSVQESPSFLNAPSPQITAVQNLSSSSSFTVPKERNISHPPKSKTRKLTNIKRLSNGLPVGKSYQKYLKKSTEFIRKAKRPYRTNLLGLFKPDNNSHSNTVELTSIFKIGREREDLEQREEFEIKTEKDEKITPAIEELYDDAEANGKSNSPEPPEENVPSKSPERRLRTVHKCSSCWKTFSTLERLSVHMKIAECDNLKELEEDCPSEAGEVDDFDYKLEEVKRENDQDFPSLQKDEKIARRKQANLRSHFNLTFKTPKKKAKFVKCRFCGRSIAKAGYLRTHILIKHPQKSELNALRDIRVRTLRCKFKCPDVKCNLLFEESVSLLLHWREFHDKNQTGNQLPVQILEFTANPDSNYFKTLDASKQKPKLFANIELTPLGQDTQVFFCEKACRFKPFYSKDELHAHQKLHGKFSCSVCPVEEDYLPNLAIHEVRAHNELENNRFVFKCIRCNDSFKNYATYLRHFTSVHFSTPFKCESCPICGAYLVNYEETWNLSSLFFHFKKWHDLGGNGNSKRVVCDEGTCSAYFSELRFLKLHKQLEHPDGKWKVVKIGKHQCNNCSKVFAREDDLRKHILLKHPAKWNLYTFKKRSSHTHRFKCSDCEKLFKQVHFLLLHWKECHEEVNRSSNLKLVVDILAFKVNPDSKLFKKLNSDVTKPTHFAKIEIPPLEGDRDVKICPIETCKRPFYTKDDFEAHKNMHGSFTCALCLVTKEFLPELAQHEVKAHAEVGEVAGYTKCRRCDLQFPKYQSYLRHHVTVHFSLKFAVQSCSICKYYLSTYERKRRSGTAYLFNHFKEFHDLAGKKGRGIHVCSEPGCSAYFLSLNTLTSHHRREHEMDKEKLESLKKCVCEECGKVFNDKVKFQMHLLSHSGPSSWQFVCEICSKKCMTKGKLKEHMRTHTKEKPFVCQVCGAAYGHRHNLRIHVNNKHGDVVQDVAKKVDKPNLTSRKGMKRNPEVTGGDKIVKNKRKRRKKVISRDDTDASESD